MGDRTAMSRPPGAARRACLTALLYGVLSLALVITGCGGAGKAQKRAYKADEAVSKQRLRLVEEYDDCMREAAGDRFAESTCERYLKSAEALQ